MAPHSSTLAWKIPWVEEPGRLPSMGSQRPGHNWVTELNWTLLYSLISSSNFLVESFSFLCGGSCHLQTVRVLLLLFQFGFLLFLFLLWLLWPKLQKTMLNSSGESGHPCVVPDFRGNAFNFSPLRIRFVEGLSYIAFIMLSYVPSIPAFWRVFIINGCWILSKAFSASIEIIIWFLFSNLLM